MGDARGLGDADAQRPGILRGRVLRQIGEGHISSVGFCSAVLGPAAWSYLEKLCARLPQLGVVVCTGQSTVAQRVRGLRLGADDWVTKPCHPEEVLARVEAVVRRRKRASARVDAGPIAAGELPSIGAQLAAAAREANISISEVGVVARLSNVDFGRMPALDPTTMGWQRRGWYLGDLGPRLLDRVLDVLGGRRGLRGHGCRCRLDPSRASRRSSRSRASVTGTWARRPRLGTPGRRSSRWSADGSGLPARNRLRRYQ